jgi:enediyne polyketide synthase
MSNGIAVIGIGCRYPDAQNPKEFWENILAQRRAFRRIPDERLSLKDYYSADRNEPDKTYSPLAALIHEFDFDRVRYRIAGSTFRATDIAQWLALQVASDALDDAGYPDGNNLPKDTTGVILGNTLTGEVTRANTLRLRWPYVQKVIRQTLTKLGLPAEQQAIVLEEAEQRYKSSFPPMNHENLAGGLSNTIPGRICNHFDFHGGGYTVDGACAASLLAITTACAQLESRDLDIGIAGGVDISLDPFELVGFAKMGALAEHEMLVYDARSSGFLPGEGCGIVVLKRLEDAIKDNNRIYAVIKGWGVSSDGQGGLTTPSTSGQALAVRRAYHRAGYSIESTSFIEGHGTGTTVGDKVELMALASVLQESASSDKKIVPEIGVGSVKANIGHTKAAAGIAGLIKTTLALYNQVLPPMPGCVKPHGVFQGEAQSLFPLRNARLATIELPLRAGVSAFGFGGINTHVTLESLAVKARTEFTSEERRLITSKQDSEVFFFSANKHEEFKATIEQVQSFALNISQAEMSDLAATLAAQPSQRDFRAAVVASHPEELCKKLERLSAIVQNNGATTHFSHIDLREGVFVARGQRPPKIGFLYPGQGVQQLNMTHPMYDRYEFVRAMFNEADSIVGLTGGEKLSQSIFKDVDYSPDQVDRWKQQLTQTQIAQPAIVAASAAVTKVLAHLGVTPSLAIGYSLGEWTALWSAGILSERDLYRCVAVRGRAMASRSEVQGTMATVAAPSVEVQKLLSKVNGYVVIAGYNTPKQTVISGEAEAVANAVSLCRKQGFAAVMLRVSNAFHSALVSSSAEVLRKELSGVAIAEPRHHVISTITGQEVRLQSVREDLCTQILDPVRFQDAVIQAEQFGIDVLVEVGPGRSLGAMLDDIELSGLQATLCTDDFEGTSARALNVTLGCLFTLGVHVKTNELYSTRFVRPFSLDYHPRFISNPCERLADDDTVQSAAAKLLDNIPITKEREPNTQQSASTEQHELVEINDARKEITPVSDLNFVMKTVLDLASEITEYPRDVVRPEQLLLRDLNLNSIASAQLVAEAARRLRLSRPADTAEYSTASLQDVAQALYELSSTQQSSPADQLDEGVPAGISTWVRSFVVEMKEEFLPRTTINNLKENQRCLLISEEHHSFTNEFFERLTAHGVDVENCVAQSSDAHFESLFSPEHHYDAVIFVLPQFSGPDVWKADGKEFSSRLNRISQPLFMIGKHFAKWVMDRKKNDVFAGMVQFGGGMFGRGGLAPSTIDLSSGSGFLKSMFLELHLPSACVVDFAPEIPPYIAANNALTEFQHAAGFVEVGYTADTSRRVPVVSAYKFNNTSENTIEKNDVLLATGGGRGIAAESVFAIAKEYGCKVAILGRTNPENGRSSQQTEEVRASLNRLASAGIVHQYFACDVSDEAALESVVKQIEHSLGKITLVLHAAGNNVPQATRNIEAQTLRNVLAPKINGTVNLLRTLPLSQIKMFITFGSVIGQTGMQGETAYAFANDYMNLLMLRVQQVYPAMRCLSLNWSVWSEIGMGDQLGSVAALARQGITPIEPEQGLKELSMLMKSDTPSAEILITGRLGDIPTLKFATRPLPLLRFLEQPRVHYPGIELITECTLSSDTDPYLHDHLFEGMQLLPAVIGVEAMTQVAAATVDQQQCSSIERLELLRPIMVQPGGKTTVRIFAQAIDHDGTVVDVVLRSAETKFNVDHFRGRWFFRDEISQSPQYALEIPDSDLPVTPKTELYGGILFQGPMFQHLTGYKELSATSCLAEIACTSQQIFGRYFPQTLLTGAPTVRDVFLHAIQPCVPQDVILPLSIERIRFMKPLNNFSSLYLHAVERERTQNEYVYDVAVCSSEGELVEVFEGFRCRTVGKRIPGADGNGKHESQRLHSVLLAPYIERKIQSLYPQINCSIAVDFLDKPVSETSRDVVARNNVAHQRRKVSSRKAMIHAMKNLLRQLGVGSAEGNAMDVTYRENGKPEPVLPETLRNLHSKMAVSASHVQQFTIAMAGVGLCACDIEWVDRRSDQGWQDVLGHEGMELAHHIVGQIAESHEIARTRVWTAIECAKKAGIDHRLFSYSNCLVDNGCVVFTIQRDDVRIEIASECIRLLPFEQEIVVAVLISNDARDAVNLESITTGMRMKNENV